MILPTPLQVISLRLFALLAFCVLAASVTGQAQVPSERVEAPRLEALGDQSAPGPAKRPVWQLTVEKLPAPINTDAYDEISPVVSRDGRRLFFTRSGSPDFDRSLYIDGTDAQDSLDVKQYDQLLKYVYRQIGDPSSGEPYRSRFNQDIWVANFDRAGILTELEHPAAPLNNALPNALAAPMPEAGHYLVINQFPERGGMAGGFSHTYELGEGAWSHPRPLDIDSYYTTGSGIGATVSEDGDVLILSLTRGEGHGQTDLYVSERIDSTHYSAPVNLGSGVNTRYRESTPSLSADKQMLYFSSNRTGRGGNDIYFCRRLDKTWSNWSLARRFKEPISSSADDSQPAFNEATGYLYFTSTRDGSSDIYRVLVQKPRPVDILIAGHVRHARTGEPIDAPVEVQHVGERYADTVIQTKEGRFAYRADNFRDLIFSADKEGFIAHDERVNLRRASTENAREIVILLDPEEQGGTITLDPIYFQQSLAEVKPESMPQLERLRDVLRKYPNIYVRIEGHTDNQGPQRALMKLSRDRAATIRGYLIKNGIDRLRVQAAGYGGERPITSNETLEDRATNRRVEVVITRIMPRRSAGNTVR